MEKRSVHIVVTGVVQGVGYRAWASDRATRLRLSGWVRNRRDGSVEMVLSGPVDDVETLLAELWAGPSNARVDGVAVTESAEELTGRFGVLPTA